MPGCDSIATGSPHPGPVPLGGCCRGSQNDNTPASVEAGALSQLNYSKLPRSL